MRGSAQEEQTDKSQFLGPGPSCMVQGVAAAPASMIGHWPSFQAFPQHSSHVTNQPRRKGWARVVS